MRSINLYYYNNNPKPNHEKLSVSKCSNRSRLRLCWLAKDNNALRCRSCSRWRLLYSFQKRKCTFVNFIRPNAGVVDCSSDRLLMTLISVYFSLLGLWLDDLLVV